MDSSRTDGTAQLLAEKAAARAEVGLAGRYDCTGCKASCCLFVLLPGSTSARGDGCITRTCACN